MLTFQIPIWKMLVGPACAFLICFIMTPPVKRCAEASGAIDIPKDGRRRSCLLYEDGEVTPLILDKSEDSEE